MILRDSFIINGSLSVLGVNSAVSSNLTALFYNNANGNVEKRTIGDIINYNASNFLSGFTISVPSIFTTNVSNVTPQNNQLSLLLASQSAGTVFAAHPNLNGQPTFRKLTAEHLSDADVMFTSHPANTITSGNIDYWNSLSGVTNSLSNYLPLSGGTMTGKLITSTPTASGAGLVLPHGVAPTTPSNGEIWTTTGGTYIRINGTTRLLAHTSTWSLITEAEILSGTSTSARFISAQRLKYAFDNLVAARASRLESGATINGVLFDGTQPITISATPIAHTHPISDIINLQTILDNKQPLNSNLTSISTLSSGSGFLKRNANNTWSLDNSTYLTGETDPYGVSSLTISGTQNKIVAIRLRNNTIVSATIDALTEAELNGTPTDNAKLISSLVLKNYIDNRLSSTMTYKGQVTTYSQLPTTGQKIGDVYNIVNANTSPNIKAGDNVAWNGTSWDVLAGFIDVSNLLTNSQLLKLSGDVTANGNLSGTVGVTINNNAVTSGKIADGAVTSGKLATILTTTGTFNNVVVNSKGLVTSGSNIAYLTQNDLPTTLPNPNSLVIKFNGGTTENNNQYTYTGANGKTINFVAGANTNITTTNSTVTISSSNTTYLSGTLQELIAGTDLTNKVWSANVLSDFLIAQVTSNDTLEYNQQTGGIQTRDWVSNAYSQFAMAIGNYTTAQGQGSTAIGNAVSTYGISSHNIGSYSNVNSPLSINLGSYNAVNAYKGGTFGLGLDVQQQGMFAVGRYNEIEDTVQPYISVKTDKQKVFVVGTGLDDNLRKNAIEVFQDDTTHFRGMPKYSDYLSLATISGMIQNDGRALVNRQYLVDYVNNNSGANLANGTYADITGSNTTNKLWSGSILKNWADNKLLYLSGGVLTGLLTTQNLIPSVNNTYNIGTTSAKYANVYATNFVGNASSASVWANARTFTVSGNGLTTASVSVNGSGNVTFSTGLSTIGTSGTYTKVTTDIYGRVTSGGTLTSTDISNALGYLPSSANTTYTAGAGISLSGNSFYLPVSTVGTGSFVKSVVQSAVGLTVTMDNPVGTTYTAGNGLTLTGTTFSMPVTVTGTGSFVQNVVQTTSGITVTMSTPPDNNTTYTAGNGLTLAGTSFSLPVTVSGTGSYVQNVTQTTGGITVTMGTPPNTAYSSGSLALLSAGTDTADRVWKAKDLNDWIVGKGYSTITTALRANSSAFVNGNITLSSGANTMIEQVGNTFLFSSTDTNTTYTAGSGLTLSGTEFSMPVTVSGTGTYVQSVTQSATGITVTLGTPPNTSYNAGTLPLLTGGTDTSNRVWSAKILNDWLASYNYLTSGDISSFTSTKLRANTNALIQGDITLSSSGSTNLTQVGNTIVISSTDNNTTYTAGAGITLSGTQFSVPVTVNGTGSYVQSVAQTSSGISVTLGTPPNTSYSAGSGLTLSGTVFSLPITTSGSGNSVVDITQTTNGITKSLGNRFPLDIVRATNDLNTLRTSGVYSGGGTTTNTPSGAYLYSPYVVMQSSTDRFVQMWYDSLGGNNIYYRNGTNTEWGNWVKLWHSGNFDPTTLSNYLPLSGGTMSGTIFGMSTWNTPSFVKNISNAPTPTYGLAFARLQNASNNKGLGMSNNGDLVWGDWSNVTNLSSQWDKIWHSGNLSNVSQLTNDAGYITSASVGSGFVPYSGATQTVNLNNQSLTLNGELRKNSNNFEISQLQTTVSGSTHFTRLTDVASWSNGNDTGTYRDCVAITLPIVTSTRWVMKVDLWGNGTTSLVQTPTSLMISGYHTTNTIRSISCLGGDINAIHSVKYARNTTDTRTIIIIKFNNITASSHFSYGKVNISDFYHGTTHNAELANKANYTIQCVDESTISDLGTITTTVLNSAFIRDQYYLDYSNLNNTPNTDTLQILTSGTSTTGALQTAKNLNDWLNNKGFVPYSGATQNVNLNTKTLYNVSKLVIGNSSDLSDFTLYGTGYHQMVQYSPQSGSQKLWSGAVSDSVGTYVMGNAYYSTSHNYIPTHTSASGIQFRFDGSIELVANTGLTSGTAYLPTPRLKVSNSGIITIPNLVGTGNRMIIANASGALSAQAIPSDTTYTAGNGLTLSGTQFSLPVTVSGSGTYVQNVTQTTNGITITMGTPPNTNTDTTYTAGNGLTLSGTQFSLPITVSGTGSYVQNVTQGTNGLTVTLGTPPDNNTTYSAANLSELSSTTSTTARLITGQVLNQWATNKGFVTANDIPYLESHEVFVSSSNLVSNSFSTTTPTAIHNSSVMVFLNGVKLPKSKITISGNTITITNTGLLTPIIIGDFIDVQYLTK